MSLFQDQVAAVRFYETGYGLIVSSGGRIVAHPHAAFVATRVGDDLSARQKDYLLGKLAKGEPFWFEKYASTTREYCRYFFSPIRVRGIDSPWFFALAAPTNRILSAAFSLSVTMAALGLVSALVVAIAIFFAAGAITKPIAALSLGAQRIASGDRSFRVGLERGDELGLLASSFDAMASELERTLSSLELRVAERTASLAESNQGLERALSELHAAQEGLELSAKMALIGRLAATVAHELNTPLGAIRSSAGYLLSSAPLFEERQLVFYAALPEAERELFLELARLGADSARRIDETPGPGEHQVRRASTGAARDSQGPRRRRGLGRRRPPRPR